jgi:hypothetical protein
MRVWLLPRVARLILSALHHALARVASTTLKQIAMLPVLLGEELTILPRAGLY